ncbi:MAG: 1-acyl-sn-glycerol-3-phosphate acyltransferase [Treponema sp.]|nr:1-acyl-sn-glycerol-3-phosphate acyltransferase [Treponema sp.]
MPYKRGRPVIDLSLPFRMASIIGIYLCVGIAFLINYMMFFTRYKNRFYLKGIQRAITVSNHTTFLDPAKIGALFMPEQIYQTMLEKTVESPFLGTFTRILGGVPIPRGVSGLKKIIEVLRPEYNNGRGCGFTYRRFTHFYPEGECFLYNQKIKNFKPGAFILAAELDIPVIPLVTVFKEGCFKAFSFLGRSLPYETLIVLKPVYPCQYVKKNERGEFTSESIKEFSEAVRNIMQTEIDKRGGSSAFFRGQMERLKGIND